MANTKTISKTKAVEMITASKGRFFTVTFTKKNGEERTMNGNLKAITKLGYITMNVPKEGPKNVDPRTLKMIKVNGTICKVKQ